MKLIIDEVSKKGRATIRRIYADWTDASHKAWKQTNLDYSLTPVQQYSYTAGKNPTDMALVIDAMDILYSGDVDGFCIVSSDSDFTRLASRLRESGMYVIGMGESKTPSAFKQACDEFKLLDMLEKGTEAGPGTKLSSEENAKPAKKTSKPSPARMMKKDGIWNDIISIVEDNSDENGWIQASYLKILLQKMHPDFDSRNYGIKKFGDLLESIEDLEIDRRTNSNAQDGAEVLFVRKKTTE